MTTPLKAWTYLETITPWETQRAINPKTGLAYPTARMILDDILSRRLKRDWTIRNRVRKGRRFQFHLQLADEGDLARVQELFLIFPTTCEDDVCRSCFAGVYESGDYLRLGVLLDIFDAPEKASRGDLRRAV